jgi:hypothetical protein
VQRQFLQRHMQVQRQALGELALQRNERVLHHIAPADARQGLQRVALGERRP